MACMVRITAANASTFCCRVESASHAGQRIGGLLLSITNPGHKDNVNFSDAQARRASSARWSGCYPVLYRCRGDDGMDDALILAAERNYFTLKERIEVVTRQSQ